MRCCETDMWRRAVLGAAAGFAALGPAPAAEDVGPRLRDLYDTEGSAASDLARRLAGGRVTLRGFVAPAPSHAPGWFALAEVPVAPCPLCGAAHDWPVGVAAVQRGPAVPHVASMTRAVEVTGVLDAAPGAGAEAGMDSRLALRDAALAPPPA